MSGEPLSVLLPESLDVLAAESPASYAALGHHLGSIVVELTVDDECLLVDVTAGRVRVWPGPGSAHLRVATDRATIESVLDGGRTLAEAVLADEVRVVGPLGAITAVLDALLVYAHGGVRSPSFPRLRGRF